MIHILCAGVLVGVPQRRTSSKGSPYVTGSLKASSKKGEVWVSFIAFNEDAQAELLRLEPGDALTISGPGELNEWTDKTGAPRHGLSVAVEQLLPHKPQPKAAAQPRPRPAPALAEAEPFNDDLPF